MCARPSWGRQASCPSRPRRTYRPAGRLASSRSSSHLSPPSFAPMRPFLRWGSQSMAPACLRPKLPPSTLLGLAPAEPSGALSPVGPVSACALLRVARPPLRPTPRSLARRPPAALPAAPSGPTSLAKPQWQAASCMHQAQDPCPTLPPPPKARRLRPTTSRMQADSKREDLRQLFFFILHRIEHDCNLHLQLASSQHFAQHVSRLLKQYLNACLHFTHFWALRKAAGLGLDVAFVADFLLTAVASREEDRDVHKCTPLMSIKALRWLGKIVSWPDLQQALASSIVVAHSKQVVPKDKREAAPIPMALLVAWERAVCNPDTRLSARLFLGAVLACVHASIRFGDSQRVDWSCIQLSTHGLHAIAYATKTTRRGQPFACTWHGLSGRDSSSSWVLQWLEALAAVSSQACESPDFLFLHSALHSDDIEELAPASYSQSLVNCAIARRAPQCHTQQRCSTARLAH